VNVADPGRSREVEAQPWTLSVALRIGKDDPEILREPVTEADLLDPLAECWFEELLRRGRAHVELEALRRQVVPLFSESGATCLGFRLEVTDPEGHSGRREFTIRSLEAVASRGARRLIARGDLRQGDLYYYEVLAERGPASAVRASDEPPLLEGRARTRPIALLEVPLAPLLSKGVASHPPVETGGVLIGSLAHCPDSDDVFVLVLDVLEAAEAQQQQFSLYYSSRTWERIETVVRAMQSQPATRTYRIVGQCHGHNFLPADGAPPCEVCPRLAVCGRTSVFVSTEDINWTRAVFRRQPWHVSHIFGLNARRENVHGLFGLRDGRLAERGLHVIPEFEAEG
jgi:hypothetical protein